MNSVNICQAERFEQKKIYACLINTLTIPAGLSSTLDFKLYSFPSSPLYREFFALIKLET